MPDESQNKPRKETDWQAESVRATAFPSPGSLSIDSSNWWETIVGEPPENRVAQPKVGVLQEQGHFSNGMLTLISQPARIDWLFTQPNPDEVNWSLEDCTEVFQPMISRWLVAAPSLQRLAFGAVLRLPVSDRKEGYEALSRFLHNVKLDPAGSTEFLFQINRPRQSKIVEGLSINRLSKWSVALLQQVTYSVQPPQTAPFQIMSQEENAFCRVELDINTMPDVDGELATEVLPQIFDELVLLGKEIASAGDIA